MKTVRHKTRRGKTRFPGIEKDAKFLGVSRVHLWSVLTGKRTSARLTKEYAALKKAQEVAA